MISDLVSFLVSGDAQVMSIIVHKIHNILENTSLYSFYTPGFFFKI